MSPSDTKTLLCAIIAQRDVNGQQLLRALSLIEQAGHLTSDLLYVAIRTCIRRKAYQEAYHLLVEIDKRPSLLVADTESVDLVIKLLGRNNLLAQAWELLQKYQLKVLHQGGVRVALRADDESFHSVIANAGRLGHSQILVDALRLLVAVKLRLSSSAGHAGHAGAASGDSSPSPATTPTPNTNNPNTPNGNPHE